MHYSAVDTSMPRRPEQLGIPDAFEVMPRAWRLSRDTRLQHLGRQLQHTQGGAKCSSAVCALPLRCAPRMIRRDLDGLVYESNQDVDWLH